MPRNFQKVPPERRPTATGTGSRWTGSKGAKFDETRATDPLKPEHVAASTRLRRQSSGGLTDAPGAGEPNRERPDKFSGSKLTKGR